MVLEFATMEWLVDHYEARKEHSVLRNNIYHHYAAHCSKNNVRPPTTAVFARVVQKTFSTVVARRINSYGQVSTVVLSDPVCQHTLNLCSLFPPSAPLPPVSLAKTKYIFAGLAARNGESEQKDAAPEACWEHELLRALAETQATVAGCFYLPFPPSKTLGGLPGSELFSDLYQRFKEHYELIFALAERRRCQEIPQAVLMFWCGLGEMQLKTLEREAMYDVILLYHNLFLRRLRNMVAPRGLTSTFSAQEIRDLRHLARNLVSVWPKLSSSFPAYLLTGLQKGTDTWYQCISRQTSIKHLANTVEPMLQNQSGLQNLHKALLDFEPAALYFQIQQIAPRLLVNRVHQGQYLFLYLLSFVYFCPMALNIIHVFCFRHSLAVFLRMHGQREYYGGLAKMGPRHIFLFRN